MKKYILIPLIFSLFYHIAICQTVLFSESFDEADDATTGASAEAITWSTSCPYCVNAGDYYKVLGNVLRGVDNNGPAEFTTATITIPASTQYITIQMDYTSPGYAGTGNLESSDEEAGCSGKVEDALTAECVNWDFLGYKINFGGTDNVQGLLLGYPGTPDNGPLCQTINVTGKTSMVLTITMAMRAGTEWMEVDNVVVIAYTSAQAITASIPSSSCPITQVCNFEFTSGNATCDSNTSGTDTYTAEFNYEGGNSGETHTITASSGTVVRTNNPDTVASGKITVTGVNEGTDVTLTVNTTACGDTTYTVKSPTCEPACEVDGISATTTCDGTNYNLRVEFIHKNASRDSVNIYIDDGTNNVDSVINFPTTGDTQVATISDIAIGDSVDSLSVQIIEIGSFGGGSSENPFISEIHYDNAGGDVNEKFEISGLAGTDLTGWTIVFYDGNDNEQYNTNPIFNLTGIIDDEGGGIGASEFDRTGIQNGAPDGLALVDDEGTVIEFLSYEGVITAANGPAIGMTSIDIGVSESGATATTESLQKTDDGWQAPATNTMGTLNTGLTIFTSTVCADTLIFEEPDCCDSLSIDSLTDTIVCGLFILPTITGNNLSDSVAYYSKSGGEGTKYEVGDTLTASGAYYIHDSISPTCDINDTFILTVETTPILDTFPDTAACNYFILPTITGINLSGNEAYYSQPNAQGVQYVAGDTITITDTLYVYDSTALGCFDMDSFILSIDTTTIIDSLADTAVCDYFVLPIITGTNLSGNGAYYSQPNAQGIRYNANDTLTTSGTYYMYDSISGDCFDQESFVLTINTSPSLDTFPDTAACNYFILPTITGINLSGNEAYYSHPNAQGTKYVAGDTVTITDTLYVYDSTTSGCFGMDSFVLTVDADTTDCDISILSVVSTCNGNLYDINLKFLHENANTDSVNIYISDSVTDIYNNLYVQTSNDTQTVNLSSIAFEDSTGGLFIRIEETGTSNDIDFQIPFISEIHYDNGGSDQNEKVEITGLAGYDLSGWYIILYNGNDNTQYDSVALSGMIDDEGSGLGALSFDIISVQNGSPDGLALVNRNNSVIEFLSYEGSFTAADGVAVGLISTDIGVEESAATTDDESLQKTSSGWQNPSTNSMGNLNSGFSLIASESCSDTIAFDVLDCCTDYTITITDPGDHEDSFNISSLNIIDTSFVNETITFHTSKPTTAIDYDNLIPRIIYKTQYIYVMVADTDKGCFSVDSIEINIVNLNNNLPIATSDSYEGEMNGTITGDITQNDVDFDKEDLTIKVNSLPKHGTLQMNPDGTFSYVASNGFIGLDYFTYQVCDMEGCDETIVYLNIRGEGPGAVDDYYYGEINYTIQGVVGINDASSTTDGSSLVFSQISEPINGTVVFNADGEFSYTPHSGFSSDDSFTYQVCNSTGQCDTATVYIQIICDNYREIIWNIPQILSPNADGSHDVWKIPALYDYKECYKKNEVIVFNRWEEKILHRYNYGFDQQWWDGKSESSFTEVQKSKLLPSGTYYYIIKLGDDWNTALTGFIHIQY